MIKFVHILPYSLCSILEHSELCSIILLFNNISRWLFTSLTIHFQQISTLIFSPSYLILFLLFQIVYLTIDINRSTTSYSKISRDSVPLKITFSSITIFSPKKLVIILSAWSQIDLMPSHFISKWSTFSESFLQIIHIPLESFIFFNRDSVLNLPWNSFQLKSRHLRGAIFELKLYLNHTSKSIVWSLNLFLQYAFDFISVPLLISMGFNHGRLTVVSYYDKLTHCSPLAKYAHCSPMIFDFN